jgi:hypothetical protein
MHLSLETIVKGQLAMPFQCCINWFNHEKLVPSVELQHMGNKFQLFYL